MSESGFIYAIGAVGTSYVKIGRTTGPVTKRLAMLQTGHPEPLTLLAHVSVERDLSRIEKSIHRFLEADRQRGEWFAVQVDQSQLEALIVRAVQWIEAERAREAPKDTPPSAASMHIGDRIKRQREKRRLTQAELAELANVNQALISRLESKVSASTNSEVLKGLAKALACTADYLIGMYEEEAA
jgi:DNA-binding transcriptional regulator YiaG